MPDLALLLPTGLVSATSYPYSITVGGEEVAPSRAQLDSLMFEDTGDDEAGTLTARLWDPGLTLSIAEDQVVRVHDNDANQQTFTGIILRRWTESAGPGRYINIEAVGLSRMLDEVMVPNEVRPLESDRTRVSYLWGKYARYPLTFDMSRVVLTNATTAADVLSGLSLRSALDQTADLCGSLTRFYVDAVGRLVWRSGNGPTAAPFDIKVGTPGAGEIAPESLTVSRDGVIKNRYYVRGATPAGSGWFQDDASVARNGPREDYIDAPSADTQAKARTIAQLALGKTATLNIRAEFTTSDPNSGWRADQNVTITSAPDDLTAEVMRITKVQTRFLNGVGKRTYTVSAGKTAGTLAGIR